MPGDWDPFNLPGSQERGNLLYPSDKLVPFTPPKNSHPPKGCIRFRHRGKPIDVPQSCCVWRGGTDGTWWLRSREIALRYQLPYCRVDPAAQSNPPPAGPGKAA